MARFAVRGVAVGFWYKCCLGSHAGADAPPFLLRMATDIAPASVASGRAVPIGAVYRRGIHAMLLLVVRGSVPRGVCRDPHFRYKCASPRLRAERPIYTHPEHTSKRKDSLSVDHAIAPHF